MPRIESDQMTRHTIFEMITEVRGDQRRSRANVSSFRRIDRNLDDAVKGMKGRDGLPSIAFAGGPAERPIR